MKANKQAFLVKMFGEEFAEAYIQDALTSSKAIEEMGVEFKSSDKARPATGKKAGAVETRSPLQIMQDAADYGEKMLTALRRTADKAVKPEPTGSAHQNHPLHASRMVGRGNPLPGGRKAASEDARYPLSSSQRVGGGVKTTTENYLDRLRFRGGPQEDRKQNRGTLR